MVILQVKKSWGTHGPQWILLLRWYALLSEITCNSASTEIRYLLEKVELLRVKVPLLLRMITIIPLSRKLSGLKTKTIKSLHWIFITPKWFQVLVVKDENVVQKEDEPIVWETSYQRFTAGPGQGFRWHNHWKIKTICPIPITLVTQILLIPRNQ